MAHKIDITLPDKYVMESRNVGKYYISLYNDRTFKYVDINTPDDKVTYTCRGGTGRLVCSDTIIYAKDPNSGSHITIEPECSWERINDESRRFVFGVSTEHRLGPRVTCSGLTRLFMDFGTPIDAALIDNELFVLADLHRPAESMRKGDFYMPSMSARLGRYVLKYNRDNDDNLILVTSFYTSDAVALDGNGVPSTDPWARFAVYQKPSPTCSLQ